MGGDEYEYGIVQTSSDGGLTWSLDTVSQKSVLDFDVFNDTICAAGIRGYITYKEEGVAWREVRPSEPNNATGILKLANEYIVAGGIAFNNGFIMRLSEELELIDKTSFPGQFNALAKSSMQSIHAVGYGQIYSSRDAGISWEPNSQVGDNYQDIFFVNARVGWIVGQAGSILKTEDEGLTWQSLHKPTTHGKLDFNGVHFHNEDDGAAVGDEGLVWITRDGGSNWSVIEDIPSYNFISVFMQEDKAWLTTDQGHILRLFI